MLKWIILLFGVVFNALASIQIKFAVSSIENLVLKELFNPKIFLGLIFYGFSFLLYVFSLSKFPLNVAHPTMTAGAIFLVSLSSIFIFNEKFYTETIIGICLICLGLFFIFSKVN